MGVHVIFRHTFPLTIASGKLDLSANVPLFGSLAIPSHPLRSVFRQAKPFHVTCAELSLSVSMSLHCRFPEPLNSFGEVSSDFHAAEVLKADPVLRLSISFFRLGSDFFKGIVKLLTGKL